MNIAVHASHCCKWHGCKYGDPDCPVKNGTIEQEYLCEDCYDVLEDEQHYKKLIEQASEIRKFQNTKELNKQLDKMLAEGVSIYNNDSRPNVAIRIPKRVARIKLMGGAMVFDINDNIAYTPPTEEQKKNLKEMLTIEVEEFNE